MHRFGTVLSLGVFPNISAQSSEQATEAVHERVRVPRLLVFTAIGNPVPSADDVVAKMLEIDARPQSELTRYNAVRRYGLSQELPLDNTKGRIAQPDPSTVLGRRKRLRMRVLSLWFCKARRR